MARRTDETIGDYEARVKEMEKMRDLELREAKAEGRKYVPGMSFAQMNAQDNAEKRAMQDSEAQWRYRTLGGMMSQSERRRAEMLAMGVSDRERFVADNAYRNEELETRKTEARYKKEGMIGQGATAAEHNAEATKYKADKDLEMGKYKVDRDAEIAAAKNASNERIAGINADAQVDVQTEKNKGTGIAGEWAVKTEQERAKTEAAKAAAQERVYQNRYGERSGAAANAKIATMAAQLAKNPKYRKYTPEQLRELAERMYSQGQGGK